VLDAGFSPFIDHILQRWPVDDGQHLLRHGLGGRKETRAEPGDRDDGFAERLIYHARGFLLLMLSNPLLSDHRSV
jgi:hypothetical protein